MNTATETKTYTLEELVGKADGQEPGTSHLGWDIMGMFVALCGFRRAMETCPPVGSRPHIKCRTCEAIYARRP